MGTVAGYWPGNGVYGSGGGGLNVLGGGSGLAGLGFYNGYIDDFRVYTRALSSADVASLWNFGYQVMGATAGSLYTNLVDTSGLAVYYPFEQGTAMTYYVPNFAVVPSYTGVGLGSVTVGFGTTATYYQVVISRSAAGAADTSGAPLVGVVGFTDTAVTADISYVYSVTPYSQLGSGAVGGGPTYRIAGPTAPTAAVVAGTYPAVTTTSVTVNWSAPATGLYDVSVARVTNGGFGSVVGSGGGSGDITGVWVGLAPAVYSYTDGGVGSGLTASLRYRYALTPYNAVGVAGTPVTTGTYTSPRSDVSYGGVTSTGPATLSVGVLSAAGTSYLSFYDVSLVRLTGGRVATGSVVGFVYGTAGTYGYTVVDPSPDLCANTVYTYSLVSYNAVGVAGGIAATGGVSPLAVVSLGAYAAPTKTTLGISWGPTGAYYDVSVARLTNGGFGPTVGSGGGAGDVSSAWVTVAPGVGSYVDGTGNGDVTANLRYRYAVAPHNAVGGAGPVVWMGSYTSPVSDVSFGGSVSGGSFGLGLNVVSASGGYLSFYDVSVVRVSGGTVAGGTVVGAAVYGTTGTYGYVWNDPSVDLCANTVYTYSLLSYNAVGVAGGTVTTGGVSPLATVSGLAVTGTTTTTVSVGWGVPGSFYDVSLVRLTNGGFGSMVGSGGGAGDVSSAWVGLAPAVGATPAVSSYVDGLGGGLTASLRYRYAVLPYNAVLATGPLSVLGSYVSPVSDVSFGGSVSAGSFGLGLNILSASGGYLSFYDISVVRVSGGSPAVVGTVVGSAVYGTAGTYGYVWTDPSVDLSANTAYVYRLLSYNAVGGLGGTVTTTAVSPLASLSLGAFSGVSKGGVTVNWGSPGTFYDVSLVRLANTVGYDVPAPATIVGAGVASYADTGLSAISQYRYALTPRNAVGVAGATVVTPYVAPLSDVSFSYATSTTPFTLSVYFSSASNLYNSYRYISVYRVSGGLGTTAGVSGNGYLGTVTNTDAYTVQYLNVIDNSGAVMYYPFEPISNVFVDTGVDVSANTAYVYNLVSSNTVGVVGGNTYTTAVSPLPAVTWGSYSGVTSTTVSFTWGSPGSFYDVSVVRLTNTSVTGPGTVNGPDVSGTWVGLDPGVASYTDTGLWANTLYKYAVLPYNAVNMTGGVVVSPTYTSPGSDVTFGGYTAPAVGAIGLTFSSVSAAYVSFYRVAVVRASGGQPSRVGTTLTTLVASGGASTVYSYTDTSVDLSANTTYTYSLVSTNAMGVTGATVTTSLYSPQATVTFGGYTALTKTGVTVNFGTVQSFSYVNLVILTNTGTGGDTGGGAGQNLTVGQTSYVDTAQVAYYQYRYQLTPVNAVTLAGSGVVTTPYTSPVPDVSLSVLGTGSYGGIGTQVITVYWASASRTYWSFYDVSLVRTATASGTVSALVGGLVYYTSNLGGGVGTGVGGGDYDYSYVDTGVVANTRYTYTITAYNLLGVGGTVVTTAVTCTLPYVRAVTVATGVGVGAGTLTGAAVVTLTASADSSYNYVNVTRNGGSLLVNQYGSSGVTLVDNFGVVVGAPYTYVVSPFNWLGVGGATVTVGYTVQPVVNGEFTVPVLGSGALSVLGAGGAVTGWTFGATGYLGATVAPAYYIGNRVGAGTYLGTLPSTVTQYLVMVGGVGAAVAGRGGLGAGVGVQTVSQTMAFPSAGTYYLSMTVFSGSAIDPSHVLTVSVGGTILLSRYSLGSGVNGVPVVLTLPFVAGVTGVGGGGLSLPLVLSWSTSNTNLSYFCVTGVQCFGAGTPAYGNQVVDPGGLSHYYPFVVDVSNYATVTGAATGDGTTSGGAALVGVGGAAAPIPLLGGAGSGGSPALALTGGTGVLVSGTGFVVPTWSAGVGLSLGGWVWGATGAVTDASLVSLVGTGASSLYVTYRATNVVGLTVTGTGGIGLVAGRAVQAGVWNHAMVTVAAGASASASVYTLYMNGVVAAGPTSGAWPTAGTYTVRVGDGTRGLLGYVDDIRAYGRTLSTMEVQQVWNLGASSTAFSVVDPTGMVMYYPFNMGGVY